MRSLLSFLPVAAFFSAALSAQVVNVNGAYPPLDTRPFGKYLVQICTLSTTVPLSLTCDGPPSPGPPPPPPQPPPPLPPPPPPPPVSYAVPPSVEKTPQTITLKLVGCPANTTPCPTPAYPIPDGAAFFVSATADSGLIVDQEVVHGDVEPRNGLGTQQYVVHGPGTIVIRATVRAGQLYYDRYAPAIPVELALTVGSASDATPPSCLGLPSTTASQIQPRIDLPGIVGLIGNPTPFVLTPQGNNTIVIYSTRYPLNDKEKTILATLPSDIAQLAGRRADLLGVTPTPKPFKMELEIPHAAALGDLATRIAGLNYSQFTVQDIGSDRVRINATPPPDCPTWTAFLLAIRHMEWQVHPEPFDMKLYYLSSTDAAAAFTSLAPGAGAPAAGGTPAATAPAASGSPASPAGSAAAGAATIAVNQPPGSVFELKSDTTPCVIAGLTLSNSSGCAPASGSGGTAAAPSAPSAPAPAPKAPPGMAAMAVAAGIGEQTPSDLLVFSDTNPGDDAQIGERKRILAQLDLPRPEMLINAWVMQNSTVNPRALGAFTNTVRDLVSEYNGALEKVVLRGWQFVQDKAQHSDFFNRDYFSYIADRYIADTSLATAPTNAYDAAQAILSNSPAAMADSPDSLNLKYGICPSGHYCLGYNSLFHPLKPRLTDFLLTLIAADNPADATKDAINFVEGQEYPDLTEAACEAIVGSRELRDRCRAIWNNLGLNLELPSRRNPVRAEETAATRTDKQASVEALVKQRNQYLAKHPKAKVSAAEKKVLAKIARLKAAAWLRVESAERTLKLVVDEAAGTEVARLPSSEASCASDDYKDILGALLNNPPDERERPRIYLTCFKKAAGIYLPHVGHLRAAIADFLFNYKLSQQYPHEFPAYDLSQSADALNSALSPIIDAFNRDIVAFQTFMRADVQYQVDRLNSATDERCCVKRLFGLDKPSFFNDGIVSVRTISGQPTQVSTTSQSVLDASTAPSLSNLANAIANPGGSAAGTSPVAGVLGSSPSSAALLSGVLNAYQTTFAQFGRSLNLSVVPRSLSTASTAEITVTLNADETAGGPVYSGGPPGGTPPNTSRVANHDIVTRIRVESVKLFEVSSFSAIIQRSRSKFPLLPPFVEIPYIGTVLGIPIPGAKEYHSSTAVMSAMVVPTAADIAYGLRFAFDQVVDGDAGSCSFVKGSAGPEVAKACRFRRAISMFDLSKPIVDFHKAMIHCFATDMKSVYSSIANLASADTAACKNLSFDGIPQDQH